MAKVVRKLLLLLVVLSAVVLSPGEGQATPDSCCYDCNNAWWDCRWNCSGCICDAEYMVCAQDCWALYGMSCPIW